MFWAEMWKISEFLSENFHFLVVKFSVYLNRRVFVMPGNATIMKYSPAEVPKDGEMRNRQRKKQTPYMKPPTHREACAFERSVVVGVRMWWSLNQFYSRETSPLSPDVAPNISLHMKRLSQSECPIFVRLWVLCFQRQYFFFYFYFTAVGV